jgi:hypothetical protein
MMPNIIAARTATPPTAAPAMTPMLDLFGAGLGVNALTDEVELGMLDEVELGMLDEVELGLLDEVGLGLVDEASQD